MRAENEHGAYGNFLDSFDKDRTATPQLINDIAVMHDLVMNVDRVSVGFERKLDNVDGSNDACAKSARPNAYECLGAVIGSVNGGQRQCSLRKAFLFYLKLRFPATSFAFLVLPGMQLTE